MLLRIYVIIALFIILICFGFLINNPTYSLIPYNWLVDIVHEKKVFYTNEEKKQIFPESVLLEKYWIYIRAEAIRLFNDNNNNNVGKNFIIASEDFWQGWDTIPLRMFTKDVKKNLDQCPILKEILKDNDKITTAFFSIMHPGKTLASHYGPFKGILRYHLGLVVPPRKAGNCFISVDDQVYDWVEGEGILFDETYKHFVKNETAYPRIILFLDIKRPFKTGLMTAINDCIIWVMANSPYNKF